MHIGMILDVPLPDIRVEKEIRSLREDGHQVSLFCLRWKEVLFEKVSEEGLHIVPYPVKYQFYKRWSALAYSVPVYHQWLRRRIVSFFRSYPVDVVHVHDMVAAQAVFDVCKERGIPVVLDLHECRPEIMKEYDWATKFPGNLLISLRHWRQKEREFVQRAKHLILVTEEAKELYVQNYGIGEDKITVLPNTMDKEFVQNKYENAEVTTHFRGGFNLLYIGSTDRRRGLFTALRALAAVRTKIPMCKLIVLGNGRDDQQLTTTAEQLGVEKHVFWEGWIDRNKFAPYLRIAQVGISPLLKNVHHDTTFANKLFQYMAFGVPSLVSDATAQANLVRECRSGIVHRADDSQDMARQLIWLYKNPKERSDMAINSKRAVEEKYHWELSAKKLCALYASIGKGS